MSILQTCVAAAFLASISSAHGQFIQNGGFEQGAFPPWTVTPTSNGTSVSTFVTMVDIDGPGPAPVSEAASFCVGRNTPNPSPGGITLAQTVGGLGGIDVRVLFDWSVRSLVNVYNASGGTFELVVDGQVIGQATAPVTVAGQTAYGSVSGTFHSPVGQHTIAVRITRSVPAGEEVFQYVDNIRVEPACYANCDYSTGQPALTAGDFVCFLGAFANAYPYANCDGSTAAPVLTANDFLCFLNAWIAGCP
jgi:hypothetical protein